MIMKIQHKICDIKLKQYLQGIYIYKSLYFKNFSYLIFYLIKILKIQQTKPKVGKRRQ